MKAKFRLTYSADDGGWFHFEDTDWNGYDYYTIAEGYSTDLYYDFIDMMKGRYPDRLSHVGDSIYLAHGNALPVSVVEKEFKKFIRCN